MSVWVIMGIYLLIRAAEDMFKKSVPILLVAVGAVPVAASFFDGQGATLPDRGLGLAAGLVLILVAKLSKESIGIGDAAVIAVLGLALGLRLTAVVTAISLFLLMAYSFTMLAKGRLNRKSRVAFLPFLFAAFVLSRFM